MKRFTICEALHYLVKLRYFTRGEALHKICAGKIEISRGLAQISAQAAHKNDNPQLFIDALKPLAIFELLRSAILLHARAPEAFVPQQFALFARGEA